MQSSKHSPEESSGIQGHLHRALRSQMSKSSSNPLKQSQRRFAQRRLHADPTRSAVGTPAGNEKQRPKRCADSNALKPPKRALSPRWFRRERRRSFQRCLGVGRNGALILERNFSRFGQTNGAPFREVPLKDWLGNCGETEAGQAAPSGELGPVLDTGSAATFQPTGRAIVCTSLQSETTQMGVRSALFWPPTCVSDARRVANLLRDQRE
jgi:hypothetical protein